MLSYMFALILRDKSRPCLTGLVNPVTPYPVQCTYGTTLSGQASFSFEFSNLSTLERLSVSPVPHWFAGHAPAGSFLIFSRVELPQ